MNVNCVLFLFELEFSFLIISYPIYFSTQNVLSLILCTVIFHLMVVVINFKHSKISHILISPTFLPWHDFFYLTLHIRTTLVHHPAVHSYLLDINKQPPKLTRF
jgi:hypothetical protein